MAIDSETHDLLTRCRAGEEQAWAELVRLYSRYVYAIAQQAYRLGEQDAEDVFQEVYARLYLHLDEIRDDDSVRPWIAQVTRRLCIDRLRALKRRPEGAEAVEQAELDGDLQRIETALDVDAAMRLLPEACNEILDRFFRRDESYEVIGRALSIPAGTIASRISRCLGKLREAMEGRSGAGSASGGTG